ncbi:MAG: hypothetical protein ACXVII_44420, partial [Solirubrobacteraceae bacterium]
MASARNVGDRIGCRTSDQLRLILGTRERLILQRQVAKQSFAAIAPLGEKMIVIRGTEEVRRQLSV